MNWMQRSLKHDLFYAGLGLACALLVVGLPAYLAWSAQLSPFKARPTAARLELQASVPVSSESDTHDGLAAQLLATEPDEPGSALVNVPGDSLCLAPESASGPHVEWAEQWPVPGQGLAVSAR